VSGGGRKRTTQEPSLSKKRRDKVFFEGKFRKVNDQEKYQKRKKMVIKHIKGEK